MKLEFECTERYRRRLSVFDVMCLFISLEFIVDFLVPQA